MTRRRKNLRRKRRRRFIDSIALKREISPLNMLDVFGPTPVRMLGLKTMRARIQKKKRKQLLRLRMRKRRNRRRR
jgi:hypothetical protein